MLDILDTAGPEEYRVLTESYMRSADGIVLCCTLNYASTIGKVEEYMDMLINVRKQDPEAIPVIISLNKSDLDTTGFEASMHDVQEFAKKYGIKNIMETSALRNSNVQELFEKICLMSVDNRHMTKQYCMEQVRQNPDWIRKLENGVSIFEDELSMQKVKPQKCNVM